MVHFQQFNNSSVSQTKNLIYTIAANYPEYNLHLKLEYLEFLYSLPFTVSPIGFTETDARTSV